MKSGIIIRYNRVKQGLTQEELAKGICSVSHLSKIESGKYEANRDTIKLLFKRLSIITEIESKIYKEKSDFIRSFYYSVDFLDFFKVKEIMETILQNEEYYLQTDLHYLFLITKFRYYTYINNIYKAEILYNKLKKSLTKLSLQEEYLFIHSYSIYLIQTKNYNLAKENLYKLINGNHPFGSTGEVYYHYSLVCSHLDDRGVCILFAQKALEKYSSTNNFHRIMHSMLLMGISLLKLNNLTDAEEIFMKIREDATRLGEQSLLLACYHNLGIVKREQKKYVESINYFKLALKYSYSQEYYYNSLVELIYTLSSINQIDHAKEYIEQGLSLHKDIQFTHYIVMLKYFKVLSEGKLENLVHYLEEFAIPTLIDISYTKPLKEFSLILVDFYIEDIKKQNKYLLLALHHNDIEKIKEVFS
ncbi:helix-turn-helix domain-containing protein [Bacillus salitolerans]|uniref:Helix-turn-helix domain-containing protein n=1 Tax=Bacillus salitolerans TaxID=1437434 RepID=A0ABW4LV68_9BACI